ncbi:MAG: metal-dependent phosphohydrolase [Gammaproteobacteria bacterium]|nr:metal-dependent phosphohydrolase [Gammaproteobacteria bacterium]MBU1978633.1 metal-dependent phosphohydrolase [Gammaproteobacteria bacterium]
MSWIQTYTGRRFYPLNPMPEDIEILDIAHALSHLCRFNGHTRQFYSVAQHSVLVMCVVPEPLALAALLHDATEAYFADIVTPIKRHLGEIGEVEQRIHEAIAARFGIPVEMDPLIKRADLELLATERRDLLLPTDDEWACLKGVEPRFEQITAWDPETAKKMFLEQFEGLAG